VLLYINDGELFKQPASPSDDTTQEEVSAQGYIAYSDLDANQNAAIDLVSDGDYEAAIQTATQGVVEAEKSNDGNKIYQAKSYLSYILMDTGETQQALTVLDELLDMNIDKRQKFGTVDTLIQYYKYKGYTLYEQQYLERAVDIYEHSGYDLPTEYADRLKELTNV
jgi:tetratricopeptide (TPR) repeat protein